MKYLGSKSDFEWYLKRLDAEQRYEHRHNGSPEKYPCIVSSDWWDDPNGPYTYDHTFKYKEKICCEACGHQSEKFPITEEQESKMHDD